MALPFQLAQKKQQEDVFSRVFVEDMYHSTVTNAFILISMAASDFKKKEPQFNSRDSELARLINDIRANPQKYARMEAKFGEQIA